MVGNERHIESENTLIRTKRNIDIIGFFSSVISKIYHAILSALQSLSNTILTRVASFVQYFYITKLPSNSILSNLAQFFDAIILRISKFILFGEEFIDGIFNNLLYGNPTGTI